MFLGILLSSIREIEVPYVFDWEHEIEVPYIFDWEHGTPQHEMQENRASSCSEGKSHEFSELLQAPGVYPRVTAGMAI